MNTMGFKKVFSMGTVLLIAFGAIIGGTGGLKITLEEVLSIGSLDDDVLFQWVGIASDDRGMIYLSDTMDYSLKAFGAEGDLVRKQGRKGQGPGEFLAPRLLEFSNGLLYVTDQYQPGIQIFDRDLSYQGKIPLVFPVSSFKIIEKDLIALVTLNMDKNGHVIFVDDQGNVKDKFQYSEKKSSLMMDLVDIEADRKGHIYLVYTFQDKIEKWTKSGSLIWSKKFLQINKVRTKKISSYVVPTDIVYKDIALDKTGRVYVLGGHLSRNSSRDVYVFASSGDHLTTFTLPETSHCIHIDSDGFLYSRANEGVTLKKYKIHYTWSELTK